jgi:hypothetical protein
MSLFIQQLPFNFPTTKKLNVKFSSLDLSSDAGLLMVKQAEQNLKICQGFADCLQEKREVNKVKHSLQELVSQRIYQIIAGYEDANDSNYLRNDPLFQLVCGRTPTIEGESLASQPTMSRWENVAIILRGDGGFSLPEIMDICERQNVQYAFGFSSNSVLKRKIDYLLDQARLNYYKKNAKERLFDDVYYRAKSWEKPRRMVMKAEWLEKGGNPRFLVTNMEMKPQELYDNFYVQRGATSEHRIKELKRGLHGDRLSCHQFIANQFRLFLSQAAYILMLEIREAASQTRLEKAQICRMRETLIKIAARVKVSTRRIMVELTSNCPFQQEIKLILQKLLTERQLIFS